MNVLIKQDCVILCMKKLGRPVLFRYLRPSLLMPVCLLFKCWCVESALLVFYKNIHGPSPVGNINYSANYELKFYLRNVYSKN